MKDRYEFNLNHYGQDYFVFSDYVLRQPPYSDWEILVDALARARKGDFSRIPGLLEVWMRNQDAVLRFNCQHLLGDCGPTSIVAEIRDRIRLELANPLKGSLFPFDMAYVLYSQRNLSDIPLLLQLYEEGPQFEESENILGWITDILGEIHPEGGSVNLANDIKVVRDRYNTLIMLHGSECQLWRGQVFSPGRLASMMIANIENISPSVWRHVFETTTGIDCRPMFKADVFQPLAASAILEAYCKFPENELAGQRTFFGHPIP